MRRAVRWLLPSGKLVLKAPVNSAWYAGHRSYGDVVRMSTIIRAEQLAATLLIVGSGVMFYGVMQVGAGMLVYLSAFPLELRGN